MRLNRHRLLMKPPIDHNLRKRASPKIKNFSSSNDLRKKGCSKRKLILKTAP